MHLRLVTGGISGPAHWCRGAGDVPMSRIDSVTSFYDSGVDVSITIVGEGGVSDGSLELSCCCQERCFSFKSAMGTSVVVRAA